MTTTNQDGIQGEPLCIVEGKPVYIGDVLYSERHTPLWGDSRVLLKKSEKDGMTEILAYAGEWIQISVGDLSWEKPLTMRDREAFEAFMESEEASAILKRVRPQDREFAIWQLSRAKKSKMELPETLSHLVNQ
jgi:hypothetical protein